MVTQGLNPEIWHEALVRLRFSLRNARQVWGFPGVASLVLACGLMVFAWVCIIPAQGRLADIETKLTTHSSFAIVSRAVAPTTASSALLNFYKSIPPETLILATTERLSQMADHAGLHITQADYRANQDPSGLTRYEVSLSAHGTYPQLRGFSADCLTGFPTLSLDGLTLSRAGATDLTIDAQFRFSIYLKPN